jgi:hypothetical protein
MSIYEKKELGKKPPYSNIQVLSRYRFCNIYRELDRQTIFFHQHLKPYTNDFPLWLLNMFLGRLICNTDSISKLGLLTFDKGNNKEVYDNLLQLPSPKYGNAYIFPISTIQKFEYNTREKFFCLYLPQVIEKMGKEIQKFKNESVSEGVQKLMPILGFNLKFHLTELLIDVAYQFPHLIDLYKEFPIGPGSLPTMKSLNKESDPQEVCLMLVHTVPADFNYLTLAGKPIYLSAENWEGIGCEFRKYYNLLNLGGRKRYYNMK